MCICGTLDELTEILMQIIRKNENSADEGYLEEAKKHFVEYYEKISEYYNASYVSDFYQSSVSIYCERTNEDSEKSINLTAEDVFAVFLR